jgi:hypothetical protein
MVHSGAAIVAKDMKVANCDETGIVLSDAKSAEFDSLGVEGMRGPA